jgi:copper oxidase (laccase) domain-containing protein
MFQVVSSISSLKTDVLYHQTKHSRGTSLYFLLIEDAEILDLRSCVVTLLQSYIIERVCIQCHRCTYTFEALYI